MPSSHRQGLPGVFPPLDGSEWVNGDARIVANILLHGVSGPIAVKGSNFSGAMPPFAQLSDAELAAVASHVRCDLVEQGGAARCSAVRKGAQGIDAHHAVCQWR